MKDEIKEILDNINNKWEDYYVQDIVSGNELKQLLDYITNLQTIEQQYSAILSENAELENKITNLQKETEIFLRRQYEKLETELRNKKAIEYIKEHLDYNFKTEFDYITTNPQELLEILGDKENE